MNAAANSGPNIPIGQLLAHQTGGAPCTDEGHAHLTWVLSDQVQVDAQADDYIDGLD